MRRALALAVLVGLTTAAHAGTVRVPQDHETIQAAVDAAGDGDTILVARGVYDERVVVNGKTGLRFVGKKAVWDAARDGDRGTCLEVTGDGLTVQGFVFRNGGLAITGNDATVTKCVVRSADGDGVSIDGDDAVVGKCSFIGCTYGVDISGARAQVLKNRVWNMDDGGIEVDGDGAEIVGNTVKVIEDGHGVDASGDDMLVSRNTIVNTDDDCIEVDGDDVTVERNRCYGSSSAGIDASGDRLTLLSNVVDACDDELMDVSGDDFRIIGNRLSTCMDDSDGLELDTSSEAGGGLVERNTITDVVQSGIDFSGSNVVFRANKVIGQGSEDDEAFDVSGSNNTFEGCQALDCEGDAFDVSGDGNRLVKCQARNAGEDGFDIRGDGNELIDCSASGSAAEGVDNEGTATVLRGGTFTGNRIDLTCATDQGASWATFAPKRFGTGGEDTQPEID